MVKLTLNLLIKGTSGRVYRKSEDSDEQYLMKITHLYLENKQLESIGNEIGLCKDLTVLYLYDNILTEIPNLSACKSLTHVYLQNNHISRLKGLEDLPNLTKLYIGHNNITVLEGLHTNNVLQELHVNNQSLPPGEKLLFDPRSLSSIAASLMNLNITGNNIDSLSPLAVLTSLKQLQATDNKVHDLEESTLTLSKLSRLVRLDLLQNPVCTLKKYRDRVIVAAMSLESLDGKDVSETSRRFLVNWKANKEAVDKKREVNRSKDVPPYLTANEMRFSSSQPQQRQTRNRKYSGNIIRPFSVSTK